MRRVELAGGRVAARNDAVRLTIDTLEPDAQARVLHGEVRPIGGWISRRFGQKEPTATVVLVNDIHGTCKLRTRMTVS